MAVTPQARQFCLSEGNREALIIRWRAIITLGLHDYFTNENKYSKIIVREILDMFEGVIKAFAESLGVPVRNRGFLDIFNDIKINPQVENIKIQRLDNINNSLSANELNSIRNILRNPEAHTLNLPSIPIESVIRCWRLFEETVSLCDDTLNNYAQSRPEFKDFCNLYKFFYKFAVNKESIDLRVIKQYETYVEGVDNRGTQRNVKIEQERSLSDIIQLIASGDWEQSLIPEIRTAELI